ncbi:MAG: MFS transporter [Planctomycetes bacterium]|nr:MFS transporter [Planctomycetota bacterium]
MNVGRYFLYFCGQLGLMTLLRFFFTWIVIYCENPLVGSKLGPLVNLAWVGGVLLAFRLFDGLTDPLAGGLANAWVRRGREKRSLLWLFFVVPPIGFVLCFLPNLDMPMALRWILLGGGMFVFFVGYTFYAIPYWSLIDDFGKDVEERRRMSNLLGVGVLGGTALGTVLSGIAISKLGFQNAAILFAIPSLLLMILPFFAQPEGVAEPPIEEQKGPGLVESVRRAFKHRRFLATLFLFSGSQMSFTVMTTCTVLIIEHLLGSPDAKADMAVVMGAFLGTSFLFFVAVPAVSRKFGWEYACVGASILLGLVYACTAFLGQGLIGTPLTTGAILYGLGGPMAAILLGLEGEAVTDCARERGGDMTSIYFGVYNLVIKLFNGLAIMTASLLVILSRPANWGVSGVRVMGPVAGGLLVLGVVAYFVWRPKEKQIFPPDEDDVSGPEKDGPKDEGPDEAGPTEISDGIDPAGPAPVDTSDDQTVVA